MAELAEKAVQSDSKNDFTDKGNSGKDKIKLRKVLSIWDASAFIICTIIGSGIFVSPKGKVHHINKHNTRCFKHKLYIFH